MATSYDYIISKIKSFVPKWERYCAYYNVYISKDLERNCTISEKCEKCTFFVTWKESRNESNQH